MEEEYVVRVSGWRVSAIRHCCRVLIAVLPLLAAGCGGSLNSGNSQSRLRALERISDEAELRTVALMHPDPAVRELAVMRIKDQDAVAYAARCDPDAGVRLTAVGRSSDRETLAIVAMADEDFRVRLAAMDRTTNQDVFVHIAIGDTRSAVRVAALRRISDKRCIEQVAPVLLIGASSPRPFIPWAEQSNLIARISDQAMLEKLMWNGFDERISGLAAQRVTNKAAVARMLLRPWNESHKAELLRAMRSESGK